MREAIDRNIGVVDETGTVIACSELGLIGEIRKGVISAGVFSTNQTCVDNATYTTFDVLVRPEYAVFVDGTDDLAHHYSSLIAVALDQIKQNNDEKFDRSNFVKNVILDNILPGDIYIKSRELHFNNDASRVVFLIRTTQETEISVFDIIQNFFPDKSKDFVINVNESDIALVKEVRPNVDIKDLEKLARSINDTLLSEFYFNAIIGIGTCVTGIKELAHSFKEAQVALEVGKVFDTEKQLSAMKISASQGLFISFRQLFAICSLKRCSSVALSNRLTRKRFSLFKNSLKTTLMFLKHQESFSFTETLLFTGLKNQKLTGLDLREFDDAIVFKVALMVNKYLASSPVKY